MATKEIANIGYYEWEFPNVSNIVGIGEKNEINDVMLIQALFRLVGFDEKWARHFFNSSFDDLPEPNGKFDKKTIDAIWAFQTKEQYRLLAVDKKIHPASYKNRIIKIPTRPLMTITLLSWLGWDGAMDKYQMPIIPALKLVAPQLVLIPAAP